MAGLLGDVLPWMYSQSNTIKKNVKGLLNDPAAFIGSLGQDIQTQNDQRKADYRTLMEPGVFTSEAEKSAAINRAAQEAVNYAAPTVWHGSPHKFDKFDSSKIGTGEGAQAYGHGLYFAESPKVAGAYQKQLTSGARGWEYDGKLADSLPMEQWNLIESFLDKTKYKGMPEAEALAALKADAVSGLAQAEKNLQEARANLGKTLDMGKEWGNLQFFTYGPEHIASAEKSLEQMRRHLAEVEKLKPGAIKANEGALYKVDLPDSAIEKMLDWDKPLSQQSEFVKEAFKNAKNTAKHGPLRQNDPILAAEGKWAPYETGEEAYRALEMALSPTGSVIRRGSTTMGENGLLASKYLRDLGIPGIRYLDQGSRGTGTGTSNYVVFPGEEGLLNILERNGHPVGGLLNNGKMAAPTKSPVKEYQGLHTPPLRGSGAPAYDLTGGGKVYPDDIYGPRAAQYYGHYGQNDPVDVHTLKILSRLKGKPDEAVTIFRAVPKGQAKDINAGDWVTVNGNYARMHGESQFDGNFDILTKQVRAKDIYTNGDSIHEFGYDPN